MHKETVNTFIKGMVKDTHPLTTPADVLTDCLNGTVITYNGNEMILQNDMGNEKIGSAGLPEGYIPVGMTEYGGIIYVASWNPKTKKGQIGSFPSPQQKFFSEIWNVNKEGDTTTTTFDYSEFYSNGYISTTQITKPIGYSVQGSTDFILHTGDKFKISNLTNIAIPGQVQVKLAVLKKDGTLEVLDDSALTNAWQIYRGKSSGHLVVIIRLLTLQSFNLKRTYSRAENSGVKVTFTGEAVLEEGAQGTVSLYNLNNDDLNIKGLTAIYSTEKMSGTYNYNLAPEISPQGIMKSMAKSGTIDFSKFKNDEAEIKDWSYFITDNYIKLNWSFDYYSLDADKQVQVVYFEFYELSNASVPIYVHEIIQDNFNGSFEEIIDFDNNIKRNNIYIVKVGYKTGPDAQNLSQDIIYKIKRVLYTTPLLNKFYGKVNDFTNAGIAAAEPELAYKENNVLKGLLLGNAQINMTFNPKVTNNNEAHAPYKPITLTDPSDHERQFETYKQINPSNFMVTDNTQGSYEIDIKNYYKVDVEIKTNTVIDANCIGTINDETISYAVSEYAGKLTLEKDESGIERYGEDKNLIHTEIVLPTGKTIKRKGQVDNEYTWDKDVVIFDEIFDTREIKVKTASPSSKNVDRERLVPMYYSSLSNSNKDKIFSCWNKNQLRMCSGADETNIYYGCSLAGESINRGADTGAGCDDNGLNAAMEHMNLPMVSIFAGCNGDQASYSPDDILFDPNGRAYGRRNVAGWYCGDDEIDGTDNFLMTVWKQSDNRYRFCTLASQRKYASNNSGRLIRLDYMLRCLLSQLFVKQAYKETIHYVTVNNETLSYLDGLTKITPTVDETQVNSKTWNSRTGYELMYDEKHTIKEKLDAFNTNVDDTDWRLDIKYDVKVIPTFNSVEFGSDFYIDYINNTINASEFNDSDTQSNISPNVIYVADWSKIGDSDYKFNSDMSIEWQRDDYENIVRVSGTGNIANDGMDSVHNFNDTIDVDGSPFNPFGSEAVDVLKTWNDENSNSLKWIFYNSFNHMLVTTCQLNTSDLVQGEINEIVVNRDSDYGKLNASGTWRKSKDNNAPDITTLLGNTYNSIYGFKSYGVLGNINYYSYSLGDFGKQYGTGENTLAHNEYNKSFAQ